MKFTPTQWRVMVAAYMTGDGSNADIDSKRVKTRTIGDLIHIGLLYNRNIEWQYHLTPAGEEAYWTQAR